MQRKVPLLRYVYIDALSVLGTGESKHSPNGLGIELHLIIADGFLFSPVDLITHHSQHFITNKIRRP